MCDSTPVSTTGANISKLLRTLPMEAGLTGVAEGWPAELPSAIRCNRTERDSIESVRPCGVHETKRAGVAAVPRGAISSAPAWDISAGSGGTASGLRGGPPMVINLCAINCTMKVNDEGTYIPTASSEGRTVRYIGESYHAG